VQLFNFSDYKLQTKILWFILAFLNVPTISLAVYESLSFETSQFKGLFLSALTVATISFVKFRIPNSEVTISAREASIFFGAIWFGMPGAIFLGAISASITLLDEGLCLRRKIAVFSANLFSSLLGTKIFYLTLGITTGFDGATVGSIDVSPLALVASVVVMGVSYYVVNSFLITIFLSQVVNQPPVTFWKNHLKLRTVNSVLGQILAVSIYFALCQFGFEFGLLLFPIAIVGFLAYRFHIRLLAQKTAEIEESSRIHLATVEALAIAIDARDQGGEDHVRRVQILALGLGESMALPLEDVKALRTAALLHDIGKLAIPDHILNKPSSLTPAEIEKMKIHPVVGAAILEKINFKNSVVATVRHHHEEWNGNGYPSKLKGEQIPVTARVLAIADAYDSIRGIRPYRLPLTKLGARRILLDEAGKKYDPKLVDIFLRTLHLSEAEIEAQGLGYSLDSNEYSENDHINTNSRLGSSYVEQIKSANREVFTLYELAKVFSSSLSLNETLKLFTTKIGELVPFDTCAIYVFDEMKKVAIAQYVEGENDDVRQGRIVNPGDGATGYVLQNQKPVQSINPSLDFTNIKSAEVLNYTSMASLPLVVDGRLVGAVSLYSSDLESYEDEHMRLLETISTIAAEAISKALYHAETETKALTDPMTGLPNARSLQVQFDNELARARRNEKPFQVLMLDLDGFKLVNDTYGHKAGDSMLREVSRIMRGQLRDYDFLARYAGDEFVALIPETNETEIHELIHRIEEAVSRFVLPISEGKVARVGVSVGCASFPRNGEAFDQLLIAADTAMYSTKALRKQKINLQHQEDLRKSMKPIPNPDILSNPISQPLDMPVEHLSEIESLPLIIPDTAMIFDVDESHIISDSIN
jgi:diguanylate cyclase (GGDEF)-like protein/putative nucleotidyltransferase with HDIG domain